MEAEKTEKTQTITDRVLVKLLLVEDDTADRRLVEQFLARCSQPLEFAVESAGSLSSAIKYLGNAEYDVALVDLGLPDSRGVETVRKISEVNPHLPIVVLTGLDDEETGLSAIKNGAADYLSKGQLLENTLVRAIRYAIERKKAEQKLKEAMEMKSEFTSMVSHELRTPLTAIKEGIAIVLEGIAGRIND
ncbi:unnamed protein product, partial [marine sediment metagenome]